MNTSKGAVTPYGWGVKISMVRVCVWQVKLRDPIVTRGPYLSALDLIMIIRNINSCYVALFYFYVGVNVYHHG